MRPLVDDWKRLICRGNRCFENGENASARTVYLEALDEAERRLATFPDADVAIAAFVVSHHNLADLYLRLDCVEDAFDHLMAAHARLVALLGDGLASPSLQEAALRHSERTRAELTRFTRLHGTPDTAMRRFTSPVHPAPVPPPPLHH